MTWEMTIKNPFIYRWTIRGYKDYHCGAETKMVFRCRQDMEDMATIMRSCNIAFSCGWVD